MTGSRSLVAADGQPSAAVDAQTPAQVRSRPRDRADFEAVVRPLYGPLLRRLTLVLRDPHDAEDAAQEAYLRAYRAWPGFTGADPRAWLYTIGLRVAFDALRRRRRWLGRLSPPRGRGRLGRPEDGPQDPPYEDHVDPDLWAALARLDPRHRAALLGNVLDGYTQREIAAQLGVAEGTVASWLSRSRAILREALSDR